MAQNAYLSLSCLPLPTFIEGRRIVIDPDGGRTNQVQLEYFVFVFVRKGRLSMVVDGKKERLRQDEVFIMMPGDHQYSWQAIKEPVELDWIYGYVAGDWHAQAGLTPAKTTMKTLMLHPPVPIQTLFLMQHQVLANEKEVYPLVDQLVSKAYNCDSKQFFESQRLFMALLEKLQAQDNANNELMQVSLSVQQYLKGHFQEKITTSTLSEYFQQRPAYLVRALRQTIGITPSEFLMQYRMEESVRQLLNTDDSVEDVALKVGFQNIYYFSTSFKKYTGVSPSKYRREQRAE